jgi:gluconate 2-dehydrogenase gamma chain
LIAQAHEHAQATRRTTNTDRFRFFTPEQAACFDAFSAQVLPTDDTPGAREANVVGFTDFALSEIQPDQKADFANALKALDAESEKILRGATSFVALTPAQQIEIMKALEKTSEFALLRIFTLIGFFSDPADGGNGDQVGWKLIGFEDKFYYQPPFGHYDTPADEVKS